MTELLKIANNYYFLSVIIIIAAIIISFIFYEKRKIDVRQIVIMVVMITLAVVGRTMFFMIPQFKPMMAIVIITGICLGAQNGFICGAMSLFISNMFFGQGPWTPWQMLGFGIIGYLAGIIFHKRYRNKNKLNKKERTVLCAFGGISTIIIYGLLLDTATVFLSTTEISLKVFLATYASGVYFNIIHGVATIIFLWALAEPMIRKINRIKQKYGM